MMSGTSIIVKFLVPLTVSYFPVHASCEGQKNVLLALMIILLYFFL